MREIRGLRELDLTFNDGSFAISGPNGSGKSGVVDAIEFCLTGAISRLTGQGTAGITLQKHGPHVDRRDDPASAEVSMTVDIPELGKSATITRNIKNPKLLQISPDEPDIRAALDQVASHPEIVLSRREIIRYVLAEAGTRSREIQTLLRLDRIDQIRSAFATTHNRTNANLDRANQSAADSLEGLKRHLDIDSASLGNVLEAVNIRRKVLGLKSIESLESHTKLDEGVEGGRSSPVFNKESSLKDIDALSAWIEDETSQERMEIVQLRGNLDAVIADPHFLKLVKQESLVQKGIELLDGAVCPLCDLEWPSVDDLRRHLDEKLLETEKAGAQRERMLKDARTVSQTIRRGAVLIDAVTATAKVLEQAEESLRFTTWSEMLKSSYDKLSTIEGILDQKAIFQKDWRIMPPPIEADVSALRDLIESKPDQSSTVQAQTFLAIAQDKYSDFRKDRNAQSAAKKAKDAAKAAADTYSDVAEKLLTSMYESVEQDFSEFDRELNSGDEAGFKARFEQGAGKLDLSVDFYGIGMFPPGAYHSEGHQDGMGVCLYLALMKRLFGSQFTFAVLDDVVMSIDSGHRKQFCHLLKVHFPDTQFVITTHDRIWARQMQSEGLIGPKGVVEFQGWNVHTGPIVEAVADVWNRIESDLSKNDVPAAAAKLRQHLEYVMRELADLTSALIPFRGDADYELGELFSAVVGQEGKLLKKASASANSWNTQDVVKEVEAMVMARSDALKNYGGEQWVVNKAVHYNEWATLSKQDFEPVVSAVQALLDQYRCSGGCGAWLYPTPKINPSAFRCDCGQINLNLIKK